MISIINEILGDEKILGSKTKLFVEKCKTYCDNNHFPKILSELTISNNRCLVKKLPYWYLRSFFIKSLRLVAGKDSLIVLYKQFYQNILNFFKYSGFTYPILLIEVFFHLFFLQFKIIKNKLIK